MKINGIQKREKKPNRFQYNIIWKVLVSLLAISDQSWTLLAEQPYKINIPVLKYVYVILASISARGMLSVILALAIGALFYAVRDRQKAAGVGFLSAFIALASVFGKSYLELGSWDYIFHSRMQFFLAVILAAGYYFIYKNAILFGIMLFQSRKEKLLRKECRGRLESFLFGKYSFLKILFVLFVLGLPYLVCFFPGTLQWDAALQIREYYGIAEMTGQQPVIVTKLIGFCIDFGRHFFHSDAVGMFFYTGSQFFVQCLVAAYAISMMCQMNAPVIFRWTALIFWGIYPIFPIWGYTLAKDTGYYIFTLLFITALADILRSNAKVEWYKTVLFIAGIIGTGIFRNNGRYVVFATLLYAIFAYRKYWKQFVLGLVLCAAVTVSVEKVYMPLKGIPGGPVKEMLSIPMQQTARYIRDHYDDITAEEKEVLESVFIVDLNVIGQEYVEELSDPVKWRFVNDPTSVQLLDYFKVWFQQLIKHPDTYVQAFLNHTYGYFYPDRDNFWDSWAIYYIGSSDYWPDDTMYVSFLFKNSTGRDLLREAANIIYDLPVAGMLYSCGLWTYVLIGFILYLAVNRKWREQTIMVPSLCMLLICMASPVGACFRYLLPIVCAFPVNLFWCWYTKESEGMCAVQHDEQRST